MARADPSLAPPMLAEVELKFQVPAERRARVAAEVAGDGPGAARRVRLQAAYFDTADHVLAEAGLALRVRREGRRWVQTLKGLGDDGLTRQEHEVPLAPHEIDPSAPRADPARHAGTPVGARLLAVLADRPGGLVCGYRTDIRRTLRLLRSRHGQVELAFDEGRLIAGDRMLPVCELEIELVSGHPRAVIEVARRWVRRHGLWLDTRSKAERGTMLALGQATAAPVSGGEARLHPDHTPHQALQAIVAACRDAVIVNAAQVADGAHAPEHVHQLRVGLRRLRSGLRLLDGDAEAATLAQSLAAPAADLFRHLGAARDAAVFGGALSEALAAVLQEAGHAGGPGLPAPASTALASPLAAVRDGASQAFFLELLAAGLAPLPASTVGQPVAPAGPLTLDPVRARPLHRVLAVRLAAWHRAVRTDAARFDRLDEETRHRLRKRVKRLRYAAEFAAPLFDAKSLARTQKRLRRLQEALGVLNDVTMALQWLQAAPVQDRSVGVAIGWLLARRAALVESARGPARAVAKDRAGWKRR